MNRLHLILLVSSSIRELTLSTRLLNRSGYTLYSCMAMNRQTSASSSSAPSSRRFNSLIIRTTAWSKPIKRLHGAFCSIHLLAPGVEQARHTIGILHVLWHRIPLSYSPVAWHQRMWRRQVPASDHGVSTSAAGWRPTKPETWKRYRHSLTT